jgi:hypothetical protein
MAKKKTERPGYGKLLDAWCAPDDAGEPVGCLATSFTFDPVFFEEECLSRFLHLETDADEDGPAYLIEREEKLAQVRCAAALVDQHHCRGSRNLRWSLLSARVPKAILHAKVSLLVWSRQIRLIIASANLTEDGYRRNLEVYGVLDYRMEGDTPVEPLFESLRFLRDVLRTSEPQATEPSAVVKRCQALLDQTGRLAASWKLEQCAARRPSPRIVPVFTGLGGKSALEQLETAWPASAPAKRVHVLSPFFDPPAETNLPATEVWRLLRKRRDAEVNYYVTVDRLDDDSAVRIHAPEALVRSRPADRPGAEIAFHELRLETSRPLHAKGIYLDDDRWGAFLLGSSNFTRAGLGLSGPVNLEANLLYLVDSQSDPAAGKALNLVFPDFESLDVEADGVSWLPIPNDDEASEATNPELPPAFGAALYEVDAQNQGRLRLMIGTSAPAGWSITTDDGARLTGETEWLQAERPAEWVLPWTESRPPSGLWVQWPNDDRRAWWPVNVADLSALPPPDNLRDLPLDVLISILTSARPLHRVLADFPPKRARGSSTVDGITLDPHQRVDTSQYLLQRARRVSAALKALAYRLARPVATEESLAWRLRGPVGVEAVAKAIMQDALANDCGAMQSFLIAELALELSHIQPQTAVGALPAARVKKELAALIGELRERYANDATDAPENLRRYVERAFATAVK